MMLVIMILTITVIIKMIKRTIMTITEIILILVQTTITKQKQ